MNSERLARILQKMLAVGNVMNEGSRKGQVAGFTLDSLLKMLSTKGVDKQTTVLDYVVRMIFERGERSVLNVTDDLNMVEESMRIPSDDVVRDSERLKQQVRWPYLIFHEALSRASSLRSTMGITKKWELLD
jgi:diaphanous 2